MLSACFFFSHDSARSNESLHFFFCRMKLFYARGSQPTCWSMTSWRKRTLLYPWTKLHPHPLPLRVLKMMDQWTVKHEWLNRINKYHGWYLHSNCQERLCEVLQKYKLNHKDCSLGFFHQLKSWNIFFHHNRQCHSKVLFNSFYLKSYAVGFLIFTEKLEPSCTA